MGLDIIAAIAGVGVAGSLVNLIVSFLKRGREERERQREWDRILKGAHTDLRVALDTIKNPENRLVYIDYKDRDGEQIPLVLDPTDAENIHNFLTVIRQEEEMVRGAIRGPAAPAG